MRRRVRSRAEAALAEDFPAEEDFPVAASGAEAAAPASMPASCDAILAVGIWTTVCTVGFVIGENNVLRP